MRTVYARFLPLALMLGFTTASNAQNSPCPFDPQTLQFRGTAVEQGRCLLRPNKIGGNLGAELQHLPKPLERLVGRTVGVEGAKLRRYLKGKLIGEDDVGGPIDLPLATATFPNGSVSFALYFIIHDTSSPYLRDEPFPLGFDADATWRGNNLDVWSKRPVAHVFVNRLGKSLVTTPFSEAVRKGFGTKFARDFLKADAKGLQIHIELVQPRRRDPENDSPNNDRIAPVPGFTGEQYQRLALLYVCASVRRGTWLIPAYHSAVDAGIKDAHDDPQNFELDKFATELRKLLKNLD